MKMISKLALLGIILLASISAQALVVTFRYDKFSSKFYNKVSEVVKEECCDSEGKSYGLKSIEVEASGEGMSKCATTRKLMAKRTMITDGGEIDLIAYLQNYAEEQMNLGRKKGSYKEFFTLTNDGKEASKAYMVSWVLSKDGSAMITITDMV
jgi:hypothetical protein